MVPSVAVVCRFRGLRRGICYSEKMISKSSRVASFALRLPIVALWLLATGSVGAAAQQAAAPAMPPPVSTSPAEFAQAADEVLQNMSEITGLPLRAPLRKTLRSREDIRAYVIRQMEEDKDPAQRHADAKSAEAFGLLPKDFDLDSFMVDLLTEQITGLYDPKAQEFYIADWIPLDDQRPVMAHELTHALEDQHFHIDAWLKAARPNDDAELPRESFQQASSRPWRPWSTTRLLVPDKR